MENDDARRAALNRYTSQLRYGESYLLTASTSDRRRMIRDETLPTLNSVIASDLDLRDLYRNQFLTSFDDVRAEVTYQLGRSREEADASDAVDLMDRTHEALEKWFELIDPGDVREAMETIISKERS